MYADVITRATLSVSAVFAVVQCPSVCLSVMLVNCNHTAEDIVKRIVPLGSTINLGFDSMRRYTMGTHSAGHKIHEAWKYWRFSKEIAVYLGNGAR